MTLVEFIVAREREEALARQTDLMTQEDWETAYTHTTVWALTNFRLHVRALGYTIGDVLIFGRHSLHQRALRWIAHSDYRLEFLP